jgi:hypothetical protein
LGYFAFLLWLLPQWRMVKEEDRQLLTINVPITGETIKVFPNYNYLPWKIRKKKLRKF